MMMNEDEGSLNENYLVNKSNYLVNAICKLNELEQKIINVIISEIQPTDKDFKDYEFKITEFMHLLGIKDKSTYKDIKEIIKGLMTKVLSPEDAKKDEIFHWISYYGHEKGSGQITIQIHPKLKPYLLDLKNRFTEYQLKNILPMQSKYAIRLYEIIKSNEYKKEFALDVDRIKEILGIEEEYELYADFKRKVILIAQREINAKSDILFDFEEIKKGRKIVAIKFIIHSKEKIKETTFTSIDPDEVAIKEVIEIIENQIDYDSAKKIYLKSKRDMDKIREAYDCCKDKEDIKNLVGYMLKLVCFDKIPDPIPIKKKSKRTNNNFEQRDYSKKDFADLQDKILGRGD
jgi:plasmid replication initiation protein